jgi:hypothetical protein
MEVSDNSRQLSAAPKARVCYVCGRQYMVHSYEIHLKQCKELFLAREALKDPRERKKLPEDPMERLGRGGNESASPDKISPSQDGANAEGLSLEDINKLATEAFNNEALSRCAFCGRTFLQEKLAIHNRSCTAENPARRVNDGVRKGLPAPEVSTAEQQPRRPATSSGVPTGKPRRTQQNVDNDSLGLESFSPPSKAISSSGTKDGETNLKLENGELRGHIGGMAGRNIRSSKPVSSVVDTSPIPEFSSKDEGIAFLTQRIDTLESVAGDIFNVISDMRKALGRLKDLS